MSFGEKNKKLQTQALSRTTTAVSKHSINMNKTYLTSSFIHNVISLNFNIFIYNVYIM